MSVTNPTLKLLPLDELEELADEPPALAELLLLLLLLPHAATAMAAATVNTARPKCLNVLPVTGSPFIRTECATLDRWKDGGQ